MVFHKHSQAYIVNALTRRRPLQQLVLADKECLNAVAEEIKDGGGEAVTVVGDASKARQGLGEMPSNIVALYLERGLGSRSALTAIATV